MTAFLSIIYDDIDPTTYAGVQLRAGVDGEPVVFNTGNPTIDFITAGAVAHHMVGDNVYLSSSVNHFGNDGGDLHDETASVAEIETALASALLYIQSAGL
jgi:hypothetical protein